MLDFNPIRDNTFYTGHTASSELAQFFARPARIRSVTWAEGAAFSDFFYPWFEYFSLPQVKKKLDNFSLISCNLHIKIMINASPFFYGLGMVSYEPLPNYTTHSLGVLTLADDRVNLPLSQRPHVYLYPAISQGAEMILPFVSPKNWINVTRAQDFSDMGSLTYTDIVGLLSANGVTTANVTVTTYAWAEDVCLTAPTTSLSVQSDEYTGTISGPASAVAKLGNALGRIPVIGKYATASSIGAQAAANIARLFGFTNVPNIEHQKPIMNQPFAQMASPEISTIVEKLTLDPKNELTIDPLVAGIKSHDELAISSLVQRESYLTTFTWDSSQSADAFVGSARITPRYGDTSPDGAVTALYYTPMGLLTEMFRYWRGTIKIRLKIICSKFHKGRLRFTWDPIGNLNTFTSDTSNIAFTRIIDISEEQDIVFNIPYVQDRAWLDCSSTPTINFSSTPTLSNIVGVTNGTFTLRVLTALTSPVTASSVSVAMFVSGGEDLEFSNPINTTKAISYLYPQSGDDDIGYEGDHTTDVHMAESKDPAPEDYLVYQGEVIRSLRQLIRRYHYLISLPIAASSTTAAVVKQQWILPRKLLYSGFDPGVTGTVSKGVRTPASSYPAIYAQTSPLSLIAPCFVGQRGAMHYRYNVDSADTSASIVAARSTAQHTSLVPVAYITPAASSTSSRSADAYSISNGQSAGMSLTNAHTQAGISISAPNYSNFRFQSVSPYTTYGSGTQPDLSQTDSIALSITSHPAAQGLDTLASTNVDVYACAGTDFNLLLFVNVPVMYYYTLPGP